MYDDFSLPVINIINNLTDTGIYSMSNTYILNLQHAPLTRKMLEIITLEINSRANLKNYWQTILVQGGNELLQ